MAIAVFSFQLAFVALHCIRNAYAFVAPHFVANAKQLSATSIILSDDGDSNSFEGMMSSANEAFSGVADSFSDIAIDTAKASELASSLPPAIAIAALAVLVLSVGAAVIATSGSNGNDADKTSKNTKVSTPPKVKEPKLDLSIPYDAAARLAYQAWLSRQKEGAPDNEGVFQKFKEMYEIATIAKVAAKKLEQDMENFDPTKPKSKPAPAPASAPAAPEAKIEPVPKDATTVNGMPPMTTQGTEQPFFAERK